MANSGVPDAAVLPSHYEPFGLAALEAAAAGAPLVTSNTGGLGEAVAGTLLRAGVAPAFRQVALPDAFLDAGALPNLHDRYGISTDAMAASIKGWL